MTWEPVAIVVSVWLAVGMTVADLLYRRGHDGWCWMIVCALAGPLALLLAAQPPRTLARLVRVAAAKRGVSSLVLHPTALAPPVAPKAA